MGCSLLSCELVLPSTCTLKLRCDSAGAEVFNHLPVASFSAGPRVRSLAGLIFFGRYLRFPAPDFSQEIDPVLTRGMDSTGCTHIKSLLNRTTSRNHSAGHILCLWSGTSRLCPKQRKAAARKPLHAGAPRDERATPTQSGSLKSWRKRGSVWRSAPNMNRNGAFASSAI